jgi:glucose/arabinose dehydrogenase
VERFEDRVLLATVLDPNLAVRTVVTGLTQPTSMAFLGDDDFLVLQKGTGEVKRIVDGVVQSTVLDLAVNRASERGLLGIALHPDFPSNPRVYLYWTESLSGTDSNDLADVPLLGNRVDSFVWNGSTLTHEQNLIKLRAFQADAGQPLRGNHDGGVIRFGPDGKLHIFIGDVGRRGWTQNLPSGPFGPGQPDDQFGGPAPDDAHLTGVVLRLNPDGSAPRDNPFARVTAQQVTQLAADHGVVLTGDQLAQTVANIHKIFSYGHRNGIGMAFDPVSGDLWLEENGDDTFSEINRIEPGMNGGWVQIAGPVERIDQFKEIETTFGGRNLQQIRWDPTNIADSPQEALASLLMLPGSHYSDPEFSWKWEMAPAGVGFLDSKALGPQYANDLFVGAATANFQDGYLFRFNLTGNRRKIAVDDPRLEDRVADNLAKHEGTESESLLFGTGFGVGTDIQTGPNGNLYVVSLSKGEVYEIFRTPKSRGPEADPQAGEKFKTHLTGAEESTPRDTRAQGQATFELSEDGTELHYKLNVANIENVIASHIHLGPEGEDGPVVAFLFGPASPGGGRSSGVLAEGTITAADLTGPLAGQPLSALLDAMRAGNTYVNVHTSDGIAPPNTGPGDFPGGEIRGQIEAHGRRLPAQGVDQVFAQIPVDEVSDLTGLNPKKKRKSLVASDDRRL